MSPDFVTWKELSEWREKLDARIGRLEKLGLLIVAAVISPKLGGPDPSQLAGALIGAFA